MFGEEYGWPWERKDIADKYAEYKKQHQEEHPEINLAEIIERERRRAYYQGFLAGQAVLMQFARAVVDSKQEERNER